MYVCALGGIRMEAGGCKVQWEAARNAVVTMDAGGKWLSVRGHRGIMEYGTRRMKLKLAQGALLIEGEGFVLESMDGEDILIAGAVESVKVERTAP